MGDTVKVGLIQMRCVEDPADNMERAIRGVREAADRGARIVCLQELFRSRYFCQSEDPAQFDLAEPIPGPSTERLSALSGELEITLVASLFEKRTEGIYHNTAVIIDRHGSLVGRYRKMHIPDDPLYYEKFYFTPGDLGYLSRSTDSGRLGVLVCWDQWFPEAARLTALAGAQILFYPTAIGWLDGESEDMNRAQHEAWETIQRAHAISNGVFVVAVNRVGREGSLTFWGQSFVCDPFGRVLQRGPVDREETFVVDCNLSAIERTRRNWPFLRDRRIDSYEGLRFRFLDDRT